MKISIQIDYDEKESSLMTEDQFKVIRGHLDRAVDWVAEYAQRSVKFMNDRKKYGLQSHKKS